MRFRDIEADDHFAAKLSSWDIYGGDFMSW